LKNGGLGLRLMQRAATSIPRSVGSLKRFPWPSARTLIAAIAAIAFFFLTVPLLAMLLRALGDLTGARALLSRSVASAAALSLGTTAISLALILRLVWLIGSLPGAFFIGEVLAGRTPAEVEESLPQEAE